MLRNALFVALAITSLAPCQQPGLALDALKAPSGSLFAFAVVRSDSGEPIAAQHAELLLQPASTLKVVTAAAFLAQGGRKQVVETSLFLMPDGRLLLVGGGDALFSAKDLSVLAAAVPPDHREAPIEVYSLFGLPHFGEGWMWDDEPTAFQPFISGLTLEGGIVTVTATEGPEGALFWTERPGTQAFRRGPIGTTSQRRPTRALEPLARRILLPETPSAGSVRLSVRDPDLWVGAALRAALDGELTLDAGPLAEGEPPSLADLRVSRFSGSLADLADARRLAAIRRSPDDLVQRTLEVSDNLAAESLLRLTALAAAEPGSPAPSAARGLAATRHWLQAIGVQDRQHRLVDGSGVSRYNLLSADALVEVLVHARRFPKEEAELFRRALPKMGRSGTLKTRGADPEVDARIEAKTGSLRGVHTLAGYATSQDGVPLAFAAFVQHCDDIRAGQALLDAFARTLAGSTLAGGR